jgi:hypothetical protein
MSLPAASKAGVGDAAVIGIASQHAAGGAGVPVGNAVAAVVGRITSKGDFMLGRNSPQSSRRTTACTIWPTIAFHFIE